MKFFQAIGAIIAWLLIAVMRCGRYVLHRGLDAIYGAPQIAVAVHAGAARQVVRDFQPTVAIDRPPVLTASQQRVAMDAGLVLQPAAASVPAPAPDVSSRVAVAEVTGPKNHVFGVMWLYLYPERGLAKRVFKVLDPHLKKVLRQDRYYLPDVPFTLQMGTAPLLAEMHLEVVKLLDKRSPSQRMKAPAPAKQARPPVDTVMVRGEQMTVAQKAVVAPPDPQPVAPVVEQQATPEATAASSAAPKPHRNVKGDVYEGIVSHAGLTTRQDGERPYTTFCLTVADRGREIPLFGAELERQVADLGVTPGDRVKVVFMGKQAMPRGDGSKVFKNLYQLSRV